MKLKAIIFFLILATLSFGKNKLREKASLFGKYSKLIQTIECSTAGNKLKEFTQFNYKSYGFYKGGNWCDEKIGKKGFYVYVAPKWYVYKKKNKSKKVNKKIASIGGKYSGLIMKFRCGVQKRFYKDFVDYGYQSLYAWCGKRVKKGYYVYHNSKWYIWKGLSKRIEAPKKAKYSVGFVNEYDNLEQIIYCPKDEKRYGKVYEYGEMNNNKRYCGQSVYTGYMVYYTPNWYIFTKRQKKVFKEDEEIEDWPPK